VGRDIPFDGKDGQGRGYFEVLAVMTHVTHAPTIEPRSSWKSGFDSYQVLSDEQLNQVIAVNSPIAAPHLDFEIMRAGKLRELGLEPYHNTAIKKRLPGIADLETLMINPFIATSTTAGHYAVVAKEPMLTGGITSALQRSGIPVFTEQREWLNKAREIGTQSGATSQGNPLDNIRLPSMPDPMSEEAQKWLLMALLGIGGAALGAGAYQWRRAHQEAEAYYEGMFPAQAGVYRRAVQHYAREQSYDEDLIYHPPRERERVPVAAREQEVFVRVPPEVTYYGAAREAPAHRDAPARRVEPSTRVERPSASRPQRAAGQQRPITSSREAGLRASAGPLRYAEEDQWLDEMFAREEAAPRRQTPARSGRRPRFDLDDIDLPDRRPGIMEEAQENVERLRRERTGSWENTGRRDR
jgi:hypothetical protein